MRPDHGLAEDIRAQKLMAGSNSCPSHLSSGCRHTAESVNARVFLGECDQWLRVHKLMSQLEEANKSMSQQLSKAESKASRLEKEVNQLKKALVEKTLASDMTEKELRQAQEQAKEWRALYLEKDQERKNAIKKEEGLQEQLVQLQNKYLLLHQQLGAERNKSTQEQTRTVGKLEAELADVFKKHFIAEGSLKVSTRQCDYLKKENSRLQEDLDKTKAQVREVSAQLELECQRSLQLKSTNQELQGLVTLLSHRLATPEAGHTPTAPYGKDCELRAQEGVREKPNLIPLLQTQAAAQARIKEFTTTDASWRKLLEQRITALETDLERAWSMQEERALQLARAQGETESSDKRFLVDTEIRSLTKQLKQPGEMLAELSASSAKSPPERQHRFFSRKAESLSQTRGQSPSGSATDQHETGSAGDFLWTPAAPQPNVNQVQDIPSQGDTTRL